MRKYRKRIHYTETDKALMWDRWRKGDSLEKIAQLFDRSHGSVAGILRKTGGIRPPKRTRSKRALSLAEREEISRGIVVGRSLRAISASLNRAPSSVSREINRNGGRQHYRANVADEAAWSRPIVPRPVNLHGTVRWRVLWRGSCSSNGHRGKSLGGSSAPTRTTRPTRCHTRLFIERSLSRPAEP